MCILLFVPEARHFPYHYLSLMLQANGDGAGFAYFDRERGKSKVRRFLTTLKPKPQDPPFYPDLEAREDPGPAGIVEARLAKWNNWRVKKGKAPLSPYECYNEPDADDMLEWLCGGSMIAAAKKRREARSYSPPRTITFVDEVEVENALLALPPDSPLVFHARMCTHGNVHIDNVHPFRVPKSNAILAHNGTISGLGSSKYAAYGNTWKKDDCDDPDMSDTRELAHRMLAGLSYREIVKAKPMIEHIGDWSKFAVMDGRTGNVELMGKWAKEDANGVFYSNLNFLPTKPSVPHNPGITYNVAPSAPSKVTVVDAPTVVKSPDVAAIDRRIDELIASGRMPSTIKPHETIGTGGIGLAQANKLVGLPEDAPGSLESALDRKEVN